MTKRTGIPFMFLLVALNLLFLAGFLFPGCSNGYYDELIDEYNKNFTVTYDDAANYSIDDYETGVYDWLLRDLYNIEHRNTQLTIVAPSNASRYEWHIYSGMDATGPEISFSGTSMSSRTFSVYIPKTPLLVQNWYTITLSVTNSRGKVLSDTGKIWIASN